MPIRRRATVLLMIVGLLAMLFMIISAYITLARFDRLTLEQAGQGAQVEQIQRSVNSYLASSIARTWQNKEGHVQIGEAAYADIPGSEAMPWLASNSPVRVPVTSYSQATPDFYVYPAVTSTTEGKPAANVVLSGMMFDHPGDSDRGRTVDVDPYDPTEDTIYNARRAFMDADGDGLADSLFTTDPAVTPRVGVFMLTELANATGGRTVLTESLDPTSVPRNPVTTEGRRRQRAWEHFERQARYLASARVVSHGGMVQIGMPLDGGWNAAFLQDMFTWARHPDDSGSLKRRLMNDVWTQRSAVEPLLRARGGLLIGARGNSLDEVPDALRELVREFYATFIPQYGRGAELGDWQRFNLASGEEWDIWRAAISLDADRFNAEVGSWGTGNNVLKSYVARREMTAINTSDELARDQTRKLPSIDKNGITAAPGGVFSGQPKYFLGEIRQAFDVDGEFITTGTDPNGYRVVRELAAYFNEMLYDYYDDTADTAKRLAQAYMLAVNTVAFAAPRQNDGKIDVVQYTYTDPGGFGRLCIGYAPQPFFAQAVAYNEPPGDPNDPNSPVDPNDPNGVPSQALLVKLFYPHDPSPAGWSGARLTDTYDAADPYLLNLDQFAISVGDPNSYMLLSETVSNLSYLRGRSFMSFTIETGPKEPFAPLDGWVDGRNRGTLDITEVGGKVELKLWRFNSAGDRRYLVDELTIDLETIDFENQKWLADVHRDMNTMYSPGDPGDPESELSYYGEGVGADKRHARWRLVIDRVSGGDSADVKTGLAAADALNNRLNRWLVLSEYKPQTIYDDAVGRAVLPARLAPPVPLYMMNAGCAPFGVHGTARPASFPTVGFMHFVPRFTHTWTEAGGWKPISVMLREHYEDEENYASVDAVPCDFGHMPIFDNSQEVRSTSSFDDTKGTGRVPWGLLVYDYFTTLDPFDANGDGVRGDELDTYRVLGRVNVNTASWHVLAGLPVIGPVSGNQDDYLPLAGAAAPAFWSRESGVLAGLGSNGTVVRFSNPERLVWPAQGNGTWRLGAQLAQTAAAYRDRMQYTTDTLNMPEKMVYYAHRRGGDPNSALPELVYRPAKYDKMRGGGDMEQHGFITLGELMNVIGFDSSNDSQVNSVLGQYTVLGGGDFVKAVSLMALLDTHYLTTRSNTFTIYTTLAVNDPEDAQASIRSQVTVDRSNLLPRLVLDTNGDPLLEWFDRNSDGNVDNGEWVPVTVRNDGLPEVIARRQVAYFNARYDD